MAGTDITSKEISVFVQRGGAAPFNDLMVAGLNGQHVAINGLARAVSDVTPDWGYNVESQGEYEVRASLAAPPGDFDSFTMVAGELSGNVPRALVRDNVPFSVYMNAVNCLDPTNPLAFTSYVEIGSDCVVSGNDGGDRKVRDNDAVLFDSLTIKARGGLYPVGALRFGEQRPSDNTTVICYGNRYGNCITPGSETLDIYAGVDSATPKTRYTNDGGATWADLAITGIAATETIVAICVLGTQLIVVTDTAGGATLSGYYVSEIDQDTGIPSSTFTKVSTGFVATFLATDAWVERGSLFISAQKGYIYKTRSPLGGVSIARQGAAALSDLSRIRGREGVVAAVDTAGGVLISVNDGAIWSAAPSNTPVTTPLSVGVIDAKRLLVGFGSGALYVTANGGKTWALRSFQGSGSGTVEDIAVVTPEVIHLAHIITGPVGRLVSTWHGFRESTNTENRILNLATNNGLRRLAVPVRGSKGVRANYLAAAGLAAGGTLGSIQIGAAPIVG